MSSTVDLTQSGGTANTGRPRHGLASGKITRKTEALIDPELQPHIRQGEEYRIGCAYGHVRECEVLADEFLESEPVCVTNEFDGGDLVYAPSPTVDVAQFDSLPRVGIDVLHGSIAPVFGIVGIEIENLFHSHRAARNTPQSAEHAHHLLTAHIDFSESPAPERLACKRTLFFDAGGRNAVAVEICLQERFPFSGQSCCFAGFGTFVA